LASRLDESDDFARAAFREYGRPKWNQSFLYANTQWVKIDRAQKSACIGGDDFI
jgi:hypothetical protein